MGIDQVEHFTVGRMSRPYHDVSEALMMSALTIEQALDCKLYGLDRNVISYLI